MDLPIDTDKLTPGYKTSFWQRLQGLDFEVC